MRALWNNLSDPCLHLLGIALLLVYLALGNGHRSDESVARSPLDFCKTCRTHFMPGKACACQLPGRMAHALP